LIADTIITIDKNSNLQFRVACNEQFNLKGFVPERPQIGPDTAVFQLYFQLGAYYQQYPRVDLTFMYQDANTGEIINELTVNGVETTGKLHPGLFRMRVMDETQNPIYYVVEMKDPATGEVITIPPYDEPFFGAPGWSPGNFGIMSVDADKDGAITTNGILFDY
jgi:hypothetical protein